VVDSAGRPVPAALVYALSLDGAGWVIARTTSTDAGGAFTLPLREGSYALEAAPGADASLPPLSTLDDVRVAPLVQSHWDQEKVGSYFTYNFYTPNNDPCGCVATCMAQLMRFHQFPTAGIGVHAFDVTVDSATRSLSTRGGDGVGGPYLWGSMPLVPTSAAGDDALRQQIGALTYDAAVAVNMSFTASGSGSDMAYANKALRTTFQYHNSILGSNNGAEMTGHGLTEMVQRPIEFAAHRMGRSDHLDQIDVDKGDSPLLIETQLRGDHRQGHWVHACRGPILN